MEDLIDGAMTFEAETAGVRVLVQAYFLEEQSDEAQAQFVWAYRIKIINDSSVTVQLLNRHWIITDANGKVQEVAGEGVIGEQPVIGTGQSFVYTSGTPLSTSSGFMRGSYEMQDENGDHFFVEIPTFSLDSPYYSLKVN